MNGILCHVSIHNGRVKRSSLEVISRFREIASANGLACDAVIIHPSPESFVSEVSDYGVGKIYLVSSPAFETPLNRPVIDALEAVFRVATPSVMAFASTEAVKDILGALGARLSAAVLPDVSSADLVDGHWEVTRPVMAAKRQARARALRSPVLVSIRSGSYSVSSAASGPEIVEVPFSGASDGPLPELREIVSAGGGAVDLAEANVVVAAGRGVKDDVAAKLIADLADIFGAAIGATRAVVETGMYPATAQIGQTGKVVAPDLYFAIGISGAIQHVAGMVNSRVIVAVNKDPDAPIFKYSTYGLVGDLYKILPPLIQELRKAHTG